MKRKKSAALPEPCLVLDYRPAQLAPEGRWAHLARPPLPPLRAPLELDPRTGQRLEESCRK